MLPAYWIALKKENYQLIKSNRTIFKKVWERVSGIEPRRLWSQLTNTQNELTNTQNELTNTQNELTNTQNELTNTHPQRHKRLHPYISEALALVADPNQSSLGPSVKSENAESIFTKFGSDKDTRHSYGDIYLELLSRFPEPKILEIGVGSVNNFPYAGLAAGGALRAFRQRFKESKIVGVDIDPQSIEVITAEGFEGHVVDQTSEDSLGNLKKTLANHAPFDLIIDDGFHDPHANVRTLKSLFELLSQDGTYVVEDVHETFIDFWKVIAVHLPGKMQILDMRESRPGVDDNILLLFTK
jgi:hypothetical protein